MSKEIRQTDVIRRSIETVSRVLPSSQSTAIELTTTNPFKPFFVDGVSTNSRTRGQNSVRFETANNRPTLARPRDGRLPY